MEILWRREQSTMSEIAESCEDVPIIKMTVGYGNLETAGDLVRSSLKA